MKRPDHLFFSFLLAAWGEDGLFRFVHRGIFSSLGDPAKRAPIERNLRRIFKFSKGRDPSPDELDAMISKFAENYALEQSAFAAVLGRPEEYRRRADPQFLPAVRNLLAGGRGAVLATPHFGDVGIILGALDGHGIKVNALFNDGSQYSWAEARHPHLRLLDVGRGALGAMKALARNETVVLYDDIDYFPDNRTMDFFGAPYPPPHGAVRLAQAAGAPLLPVYAIREGDRHRVVCDEPLDPGKTSQEELERALLRSMERRIAAHPSQWFMFQDPWDLPAHAAFLREDLRRINRLRPVRELLAKILVALGLDAERRER